MRFKDKVAIITGAAVGIGLEIAEQLAAEGARIVLNNRTQEKTLQAADRITQAGGTCIPVSGDSGELDVIRKMVDTAVAAFGQIDIVIANAGITLFGDFFTYSPESFNKVLQVNLGGTFFLAQAAANQMKTQPTGGTMLFMSSVTGHQAHRNLEAYGMTKAGIEMLAKSLVIELSPYQISVNAIAPGATLTERTLEDSDYTSVWSRITPMGRPANVKDIAAAALFFVSDAARHVTGQSLVIDGGWTAISPPPAE
jgi:glucose 1-dehydrogenase